MATNPEKAATLYRVDGTEEVIHGEKKGKLTLTQAQKAVGGYVERVSRRRRPRRAPEVQ